MCQHTGVVKDREAVDVSTRPGAWIPRAGVVALLATAGLVLSAGPAQADPPEISIVTLSSGTLRAGESATLTFRVSNPENSSPPADSFDVKVTFQSIDGISCDGQQCDTTRQINAGQSEEFTVTLKAAQRQEDEVVEVVTRWRASSCS